MLRNGRNFPRGSKYSGRIMVAAIAALIPLVAGCEAGSNAPTLQWHQPADGTGKTVRDITISNAFVLGAPIGKQIPAGQNAGLFLSMVNTSNQTTDHLVSVTADVAKAVKIPGNQVTLTAQHTVLLAGPKPQLVLVGLLHPLTGGSVVTIQLTFKVAGQVTLQVPVMPRAQYYTTLRPAPAPATPTGSPTPTGTGTAKSSPSSTPSPSSS